MQLLRIVDRSAASLHLVLGITEERSNELCRQMDALFVGKGSELTLSARCKAISALAESLEEYTFMVITHYRYMIRHGLSN